MSKKIIAVAVTLPMLFGAISIVAAQSVAGTGSASIGANVTVSDGGGELIQLNNLTVQSVTQNGANAEIIASSPYVNLGIYGGAGSSNGALQTTPAQNFCLKFNSQNDNSGTSILCPNPPPPTPIPCVGPVGCPPPASGPSYRIEVDQNTRLFLRDRTLASISDFSTGDTINVFGFYNTDGSVNALAVRDLSKPIEKTFIQLNNVQLISVSGAVPDATIVVAQQPIYPCYSYGRTGINSPIKYPCPLPLMNLNSAPVVPKALMPVWNIGRKYEVHIDAQTVVIDRTHNTISIGDMKIGDMLNIYGETDTTGVINADIVRDLDIPAAATTVNGTITQVNADGSFAMRLDDGTTVTVQNPIAVGVSVHVTGVLDRTQNIISQVSDIMIGNQNSTPWVRPLPILRPQSTP